MYSLMAGSTQVIFLKKKMGIILSLIGKGYLQKQSWSNHCTPKDRESVPGF